MKTTFWWNSPCKSVSSLFRELAERTGDVKVVCERGLSDDRRRLGFTEPDFGRAVLEVLPADGWQARVDEILAERCTSIHVFAGLRGFPKITYARRKAQAAGLETGIMTEAPFNPESGIRRIAKAAYVRAFLPLRVSRFASASRFVLSLSGDVVKPFVALGWTAPQVFPFGYFPPQSTEGPIDPPVGPRPFELLCTGYLVPHKGVDILLDGLARLRDSGLSVRCTITGHGPQEGALKQLANRLGLRDEARFVGVLSSEDLDAVTKATDLFVAPGITEPWGIRVNEALLAGLPVAISRGIGASELVAASGAGVVFRPGDAADLANEIAGFLSDPERIARARANTRSAAARIQPRVAAEYLQRVIEFSLGWIPDRPRPPWLAAA